MDSIGHTVQRNMAAYQCRVCRSLKLEVSVSHTKGTRNQSTGVVYPKLGAPTMAGSHRSCKCGISTHTHTSERGDENNGAIGSEAVMIKCVGQLQLNQLQVLPLFFICSKKCWSSRLHVGCGVFKLLTCSLLQPEKEKPLSST